ncbi:tRNA-dihydrouridine(47) synthase [NAD(P)(+)]-like protein, partial [Stegodyphus mimosarum]
MEAADGTKQQLPGTAHIKSQFLLKNHVRELDLDFVSAKDQQKVSHEHETSDEPPRKKLKGKLKGQNKHRPRNEKTAKCEKFCFKMAADGVCPYGNSCCYSHNVNTYLEKKPPDIGSYCYLYRTFGKCPYSFCCRFASDHLKESKNLVIEDLWEVSKDRKLTTNFLSKDLQKLLRRRLYNFEKTNKLLKEYFTILNEKKCEGNSESSNEKCTELLKDADVNLSENKASAIETHRISDNDDIADCSELTTNKGDSPDKILKPINSVKLTKDMIYDGALMPEKKQIDFSNKLYLAPLTTVGNLPFRRICKEFGADITCSEMTLALSLLQGQLSEWALLRRHHTEDVFGIQLCGAHPDIMARCAQLLSENTSFDFLDLNLGCPLDTIYKKGAGCGLMNRMKKLEGIIYSVSSVINVPLTVKMRTGIYGNDNIADSVIKRIQKWKNRVSLITLHGRSREQRYTKSADWDYINYCNTIANPIPLFGNGDILSYEDYNARKAESGVSGIMIARGALIKPWIFKEIKEQMHWDISSSERFDILKNYTNYGLEHWGSDTD